jgi:hypothetical protein
MQRGILVVTSVRAPTVWSVSERSNQMFSIGLLIENDAGAARNSAIAAF